MSMELSSKSLEESSRLVTSENVFPRSGNLHSTSADEDNSGKDSVEETQSTTQHLLPSGGGVDDFNELRQLTPQESASRINVTANVGGPRSNEGQQPEDSPLS